MKLLTERLKFRFDQIGNQENIKIADKIIVAKFFNACSNWTWYATEYFEEDRLFFGYVDGFEGEWGYFSLDELESIKNKLGLPIERDLFWTEKKFSEINN